MQFLITNIKICNHLLNSLIHDQLFYNISNIITKHIDEDIDVIGYETTIPTDMIKSMKKL